jgi:hypothetical protein
MKIIRYTKTQLIRISIILFAVVAANSSRGDLVSAYTWPGSFTITFTDNNNVQWKIDQTSPAWKISGSSSDNTWCFSPKTTTGDFAPTFCEVTSTAVTAIYYFEDPSIFANSASSPPTGTTYVYAFARRVSGGTPMASPTLHGFATQVAIAHVKSFDNDPTQLTTFYLGTDTSTMDSGVSSSFVAKNMNGTWVSLGYGVDCGACYSPYVTGFSFSGSTVKVTGYFDRGYDGNGTEVICGSYINWNNTGGGYWSYP